MSKSIEMPSESGGEKKYVEEIPRSAGRTTKQVMNKHIQDENDVITEEDFRNLNINPDISNDTTLQPILISNNTERPKDEDKDPVVITPWDVIS